MLMVICRVHAYTDQTIMDVVCLQIMLFDSGISLTTLTWQLTTLVSTQMLKKVH